MNLQEQDHYHQSALKRNMPRGTCLPNDLKKYQYIRRLINEPLAHTYILPIPPPFSPFVIVRMPTNTKKDIFKMYYHPSKTFLLSAQEQGMSIGCNYLISRSTHPAKDSNFVAKFRGNFSNSQFNLFDSGDKSSKTKNRPRMHLAYMKKHEGSLLTNKSQKMLMVVPKPQQNSSPFQGVRNFEPMQLICEQNNLTPISKDFQNKKQLNIQQLIFQKGQKMSGYSNSVCLWAGQDAQSLVVRKKSDTFYELEIGCPLTIVQGFGYLLALIEAQYI